MNTDLPTSLEVNGVSMDIQSDHRSIMGIMEALVDPELTEEERGGVALAIFYPDWKRIPPRDYKEALEKCFWFINGGEKEPTGKKSPALVNWAQDYRYIASAVSKALGVLDIRAMPDLHWWTFLSGYLSIGDCFFAQIVSIRNKKARGKPLEKWEREFYRENREAIDIKKKYTEAEDELVRKFTGIISV